MDENISGADSFRLPQWIGERYELKALLGRGGMAEVHVGLDTRLNRTVAVKILRKDLAMDSSFQRRFQREAQAVAPLNHPNIVAIYDTGTQVIDYEGAKLQLPYIVMEYLEGQTVRDIIKTKGQVPLEQAVEIIDGVLAGLEYAHASGLIHRDIKPGNIMITRDNKVKLMDFGIVRSFTDSQATMTHVDAMVGTVQYISPEQARGETVDLRCDIYATGCVFFELLTGRMPFTGDSAVAIAVQHASQEPPEVTSLNPAVPPSIGAIVKKAMAKHRDLRYQNASQMRSDLAQTGLLRASGASPYSSAPAFAPGGANDETMILSPTAVFPRTPGATGVSTSYPAFPDPLGAPAKPASVTPVRQATDVEDSQSYDHDDQQDSKRQRKIIISVASVIAVLLVIFVCYLLFSNSSSSDAVEIPEDIVGSTQAEARTILEDLGLKYALGDPVESDDVEEGLVADTTPTVGRSVALGSTVTVHLSSGVESVTIPESVIGATQAEAKRILENLGLTVEIGSEVSSSTVTAGLVAETTPAAGSQVKKNLTVTLHLSAQPTSVTVPSVIGLSASAAKTAIENAGLVYALGDPVASDTVDEGLVAQVSPTVGSSVQKNTTVTVRLSSGPATVSVPSIIGLSETEAKKAIEDAGLVYVNGGTVPSTSVNSGYAVSSNPTSGTVVDIGSSVTVYYSSGSSSSNSDTNSGGSTGESGTEGNTNRGGTNGNN